MKHVLAILDENKPTLQAPASINLLDLFGITQVFDANSIVIDVPFSQTQGVKPELVRDYSILFIESITPKFIRDAKV